MSLAAAEPPAPPPLVDIPLEEGGSPTVISLEPSANSTEMPPPDEVLRLDLSELPEEEAETILDVLGKDSVFRAEEKGRIE